MNAWLQRRDFSCEEFELADARAAFCLLREFDWRSELKLRTETWRGRCDPGLGLIVGDGHVLHICPDEDGRSIVHFHHPVVRKILWFDFRKQKLNTWYDVPMDKVELMIESLFRGDYNELVRHE